MHSKVSESKRQQWQDPKLRKRMLAGSVNGGEASRNMDRATRIERALRLSRIMKLKRLSANLTTCGDKYEEGGKALQ